MNVRRGLDSEGECVEDPPEANLCEEIRMPRVLEETGLKEAVFGPWFLRALIDVKVPLLLIGSHFENEQAEEEERTNQVPQVQWCRSVRGNVEDGRGEEEKEEILKDGNEG